MKLDRQTAVAELGVPDEFYDELLHDFLDSARAALEGLEEAVRKGQLDDIRGIAHKVKGSAASIRLEEMRTIAHAIEVAGREENGNKDALRKLTTELRRAVEELRTLLS